MSYDEQKKVTKDLVKEIEELREMKKLSVHNVPIEAFHDTTNSLGSIEKQVSLLSVQCNPLSHISDACPPCMDRDRNDFHSCSF